MLVLLKEFNHKRTKKRSPRRRSRRRRRNQLTDRARKHSAARGYNAAWKRLRKQVLDEEPTCQYMSGHNLCGRLTTEVDHIVPLSEGGTNQRHNLRAMCKKHHSRRTAIEQSKWGGKHRKVK